MRIIYVKNGSERNKKFQLQTVIYEQNGQKFVKKSVLCKEALPHLHNMKNRYRQFSENITNPKLKLATIVKSSETSLVFEYIDGESLAKKFSNIAYAPEKVKYFVSEYVLFLAESFKTTIFDSSLHVTQEMREIFGDIDYSKFDGEICFDGISNIDLVFSNIIYNDDEIYIIDYEWLVDGHIPLEFMMYRQLYKKDLLDSYDFKNTQICKEMESNFIEQYVVQDAFHLYSNRYQKRRVNIEQIIHEKDKQLQEKEQHIQNLSKNISQLEEFAESMRIKNRIKKILGIKN